MRARNILLLMAPLLSCKNESNPLAPEACGPHVGSVTATVSVGSTVTFDWLPRCPVAIVLVEDNASDMWLVSAPGLSSSSTESANVILPPLVYGQIPSGAEQNNPSEPLTPGTTYELILWRILPASSTAQCQDRFGNACLLTVKAFQR